MITKRTNGYYVKSKSGRNLGGPYRTRAAAERRLVQVERFKHMSKKRGNRR